MWKNACDGIQKRRMHLIHCRGRQRKTFVAYHAQLLARGNRQRQISANSAFRACSVGQNLLQIVQGSPCQVQYDHNRQIPCHRLVLLAAIVCVENGLRGRRGRIESVHESEKQYVLASQIRLPYGACVLPTI